MSAAITGVLSANSNGEYVNNVTSNLLRVGIRAQQLANAKMGSTND